MLRRHRHWLAWLALLLGGCVAAAQPEPPSPTAVATAPAAAEPAEVRLHLPVEPATLDPAETADAALLDVIGNLTEGLAAPVAAAPGEIAGAAAERWESADGRQFIFHLRPEARWSDGRPVTAHDFVRGWLHLLDPAVGAANAYLLYDIVGAEAWNALDPTLPDFAEQSARLRAEVQVVALDDRRLQVTLQAPNPEWPGYTAHPALAPRRADVPFGTVSNGPFRLAGSSGPGEIRLERNPHYWDREAVRLDAVTYHVEPDAQAALRLFEMGYLHLVMLPPELAEQVPAARSMAQPSTMGLVFNTAQPRLANPDLRRALSLALNRTRVAAEAGGAGASAALGLVPPSLAGGWSAGEGGQAHPQSGGAAPLGGLWTEGSLLSDLLSDDPAGGDLDQARRLWARARAALGVDRVTLRLLHASEAATVARAVQRELESALDGLTIELHAVPFAQRLERVRFGQFDLVLQGWLADHDDPLAMLTQFTTAHPANGARWVSGEYDALIRQAAGATGDARRSALAAAERLLLDEAPVVPLYHPVRHWAVSPDLEGLVYRPLGGRFDLKHAWRKGIAPAG